MSQKNLLLLSGSRASGIEQNCGFLDFAEPWIREFFGRVAKPILFVPYARPSGISEREYFEMVADRFRKMNLEASCAPSEGISDENLRQAGGIFVGGGHTPTLLHRLQSSGSLQRIRVAVENGLPYLGSSAGTLITCPTIKTNNDMPCPANDIIDLKALGLISLQLNCHYMDDSMHDPKHHGETRDTRLTEFCIFNPNTSVLGLYEGQALRVRGKAMELWTSPNARGTRSPLFLNATRTEIECQIGVPKPLNV